MRSPFSYLLAHGKQQTGSLNCPFVTFTPADDAAEAFIGMYDGFVPYDPGGECPPRLVLDAPVNLQMLHELGLKWFLPFLERMAAGELIAIEDLQHAFRVENGRDMEVSGRPYNFGFMNRRV
jgi:hypothetical protein